MDSGPQFRSKIFETLCPFLHVKHLRTTACYTKSNSLNGRYNKTIVVRLRHYVVAAHQSDWGLSVQLLTFVYKAQVHCTRGMTPFSLVHSCQLSGPTTVVTLPTDAKIKTPPKALCPRLLSRIAEMRYETNERTKPVQQRLKLNYAAHVRKETCLRIGQLIYVDHSPLLISVADKWPWNHTQNSPGPPLYLITSLRQNPTKLLSTRAEFRTIFPQTGHRQHQLMCKCKKTQSTTNTTSRYRRLTSETLEKATTKQSRGEISKANHRSIPPVILPDTQERATKGTMWCDGMDKRHGMIRWDRPRTFCNTS